MNTRIPPISATLLAGLLLASGYSALGFEVEVDHFDVPQCDPLVVPVTVDELGPPDEGFPPDEQVVLDPAGGPFEPNCSGLMDVGLTFDLLVINNSGRSFTEVWFVADSPNFWVGNFDGFVQDAPAMLIDRGGINRPLISESIVPDEIFQPGEIWVFRIHHWVGPPIIRLGSLGRVGNDSIAIDPSVASLIAIPEGDDDLVGMTFSFDFTGPTNGLIDGFGFRPIFEGDIVTVTPPGPPGPNPPAPAFMPPPGLQIGYNAHFRILNLAPGIVPDWRPDAPVAEVDALSYGNDIPGRIRFSVDEFAEGDPSVVNAIVPEGAMGALQAAADTFDYRSIDMPTPIGGPVILHGNAHATDGDGDGPFGVGLLEPNPPQPFFLPDEGDNLDAVDFFTRTPELDGPVFFSLDSRFPDPIEGPPANTGSALSNGFFGGDVLVVYNTVPGVALPFIYAPAALLGLDLIAGEDSDDLDALSVIDNGDGEYVPADDRILFSVRRGSAVVGVPDSRLNLPITPGDILQPPAPGAALPGIYIAAEQLGLKTRRSGDRCADSFPAPQVDEPEDLCDDLDALDRIDLDLLDSDNDGVTDALDNCTYQVNPAQRDTDGDNIGNACDPDIAPAPGDCIVNFLDLNAMKLVFFSNPTSPNWNPDADLNGDASVNFADLTIVKAFFFGPPGPSGLPNPCG